MSRSDAERVADILDGCRRLRDIALAGRDEFFADEILQDAACYRLAVIGEALNHLSEDFAAQHPDLQVPEARGMRNRLNHEYYDIDLDVVWDTITTDIPDLEQTLLAATAPSQFVGVVEPVAEVLGSRTKRGS